MQLSILVTFSFGRFRLWEAGRLQLLDGVYLPSSQSLALCLETLLTDKLLGINLLSRTDGIHTTVGYLDARIYRVGEHDQLAVWILPQEVLVTLRGIHRESLDVWITIVVCIVEDGGPNLVLIPLLQTKDVVLIMVVHVEVGDVELAVVEYHQDAIVIEELAEQATVLIIVDTVDIWVEPNLSATQGAVSVTLQTDAADSALGEEVALGGTSLDEDVGEVLL